jgi:hypothetical protein
MDPEFMAELKHQLRELKEMNSRTGNYEEDFERCESCDGYFEPGQIGAHRKVCKTASVSLPLNLTEYR